MPGQENLQIIREIFAAWNAHDIEAFVKRLDQKTTWESDTFPAPFSGHEGARQFFKFYVGAFPDLHLDIEQILAVDPYVIVRWRSNGDASRQSRRDSTHCSQSQPAWLQRDGSQGYESGPHLGLFRRRAPAAANWCPATKLTPDRGGTCGSGWSKLR
jgi:hypothetical protein